MKRNKAVDRLIGQVAKTLKKSHSDEKAKRIARSLPWFQEGRIYL